MIRSSAKWLIKQFCALLGLRNANALSCYFAEEVAPVFILRGPAEFKIHFSCPNRLALWRAQSLYEKEPETIRWIDGFANGDTLLDIGANVGVFSLFAAARGHQVMAVEPEAANFALLNTNLHLNHFDNKVQAFNLALADQAGGSVLYLSEFGAARALHTVGREENHRHEKSTAAFRQGVWQMTMDQLLTAVDGFFPSHIKIDVDGAEARIIAGAKTTLRDPRLKSVLIELNEDLQDDCALVDVFMAAGFRQSAREHSASVHKGEFNSTYNYIFAR